MGRRRASMTIARPFRGWPTRATKRADSRHWRPLPGEAERGGAQASFTSVCRTPPEGLDERPKGPFCSLIGPYFAAHVTAKRRRIAT
jgi:hypothetical protein